jgi:hypothetical protein
VFLLLSGAVTGNARVPLARAAGARDAHVALVVLLDVPVVLLARPLRVAGEL